MKQIIVTFHDFIPTIYLRVKSGNRLEEKFQDLKGCKEAHKKHYKKEMGRTL
jgi:hypothetical protein